MLNEKTSFALSLLLILFAGGLWAETLYLECKDNNCQNCSFNSLPIDSIETFKGLESNDLATLFVKADEVSSQHSGWVRANLIRAIFPIPSLGDMSYEILRNDFQEPADINWTVREVILTYLDFYPSPPPPGSVYHVFGLTSLKTAPGFTYEEILTINRVDLNYTFVRKYEDVRHNSDIYNHAGSCEIVEKSSYVQAQKKINEIASKSIKRFEQQKKKREEKIKKTRKF